MVNPFGCASLVRLDDAVRRQRELPERRPRRRAGHRTPARPLPRAIESDVPALFISGTLDSRTPPANADEVRRGFASSTHLVIDGGGHDNDLFLASPLILDRIDAFLAGSELPESVSRSTFSSSIEPGALLDYRRP